MTKQKLIFAAGADGRWVVAGAIVFGDAGFLVGYMGRTFFFLIGGG